MGKVWSPREGSKEDALVELGELLDDYARAPEDERTALEQKLVADATALLARF